MSHRGLAVDEWDGHAVVSRRLPRGQRGRRVPLSPATRKDMRLEAKIAAVPLVLALVLGGAGARLMSRKASPGHPRQRVPMAATLRKLTRVLAGSGVMLASVALLAGWLTVRLVRDGDVALAIGVGVAALVLALFAAIYIGRWLYPRCRGEYVILQGPAVDEFQEAANEEGRSLGRQADRVRRQEVADRLWILAVRLGDQTKPNQPSA